MFTHHSHNWFIEAVALWISFMPAFGIILLIAAAQIDRLRRSVRHSARLADSDVFSRPPILILNTRRH